MLRATFFASYFLFILTQFATAKLSCKNENGEDVDWEIFYKIPRLPKSTNKLIKTGEAYAFLDIPIGAKRSDTGKWVLSNQSVEEPTTAFAKTYLQVIKDRTKIAYIIYNDQEPEKNSSSTHWGHTKGMVVTDGKTGFWLIHSIPKYPNKPEDKEFNYPDNALENGQSGLCVSFDFETLPKITNLLMYSRPNIYAKNSIPAVNKLQPEVAKFFYGRAPVIKNGPWNISSEITSLDGETFLAFAKHTKWDQELYDAAVAPNLRTSLYVETWRTGRGDKLPADCTDKFTIYNVEQVALDFKSSTQPDSVSFQRTDDHSKWAIAQQGYLPWVCVGDINRMDSQRKRGGGTVCVKSSPAWKAFKDAIAQYEGCSLEKRH